MRNETGRIADYKMGHPRGISEVKKNRAAVLEQPQVEI